MLHCVLRLHRLISGKPLRMWVTRLLEIFELEEATGMFYRQPFETAR